MQTSKYLAARYLSAPEFFSSGVAAEYEKLAGSSWEFENLFIFFVVQRQKGGGGERGRCEEDRLWERDFVNLFYSLLFSSR